VGPVISDFLTGLLAIGCIGGAVLLLIAAGFVLLDPYKTRDQEDDQW
jgi:hypothetical protein